MDIFRNVALILGMALLTSCSWLVKPPEDDPAARNLVEGLKQANQGLRQYKALGNVRLEQEQELQSVSSMAIAAVLPSQIRVELLSTVGQPVTSLVADGQTICIRTYGNERIYHMSQSTTALERLIHIPIGVEQLQGVLIGRPELPRYGGAQLVEQNNTTVRVVLKDRWRRVTARMDFDAADATPRMLEVFDEEGRSLYRVNWTQWQRLGPYQLPSRLQVENDAGYRVVLGVRRFWPNAAIASHTFELDSPGQIQKDSP
jgi:outer membrane biogenesis lipoprotein LolB